MNEVMRNAIFCLFLAWIGCVSGQNVTSDKEDRAFNVLNIVSFPNNACNTSTNETGVCYSSTECIALGGIGYGDCANGFGTCCIFTATCGATISLNNTYFKTDGTSKSPCAAKVCKMEEDICQIRLDFVNFHMDNPENKNAGDANNDGTTQCQKSNFQISSDSGNSPKICGTNDGYHMIVEAQDACNEMTMFYGSSSQARSVNIRVSQFACSAAWKAPEGCTQWFTGVTNTIYSYNYKGGIHLADQNYMNCIRREEGYCSIGFYHESGAFGLDSTSPGTVAVGNSCTTDFVTIPRGGPTLTSTTNYDRFCGGALGAPPATTRSTVYTRRYPFQLGVSFDVDEAPGSATSQELNTGFAISYTQGINCS